MTTRIRIPLPLAGALGALLAVSCQNPVCGCPPARDEAVMYGRVTDPAGSPVANALVEAEGGPAGCEPYVGKIAATRTGADGRYRTMLYDAGGEGTCLRAYAVPPAGSTLRGSDTASFQVQFAYPRPVDSARVDLVLRAP